ncbi:HNH endonuclease, partial [Marisediminicola antarctica]
IPAVLGGNSQILDLGTGRRLFTRAQRIAFAERDGGCAITGCGRPPSYTEAHHIHWWSHGGTTNLNNGILLCTGHHHIIHKGWTVQITDNTPWFTPPTHIDPTRTPKRGGKLPTPALQ